MFDKKTKKFLENFFFDSISRLARAWNFEIVLRCTQIQNA
ncbi:hypothetical protein RO31_2002 [Francisella tularensis subsp. tularensis str. SCHU S4 substr. NR-28534]|nr:hypothetical protein RO31_2002 [Francisella tularensis subsp. tularensis str. SCHU S4 substr. NR-28534]